MLQQLFNWIWFGFLIAMIVVRKTHEHKAGQGFGLKGTPKTEISLMVLWRIAVSVLPLFYVFGAWLDFANIPFKLPSVFGFTGIFLFLSAIWLLHRSHVDLGRLWSRTVEPEADQKIVTDGVYKRIRHPMYAAHVLWGIAQTLLLPNLIAGPMALLLIFAVICRRIPREEKAMLNKYGDEYHRYMKATGRIFPKLLNTKRQ